MRQISWHHEHDPLWAAQIKKYWEALGLGFPGVDTHWSAVFVVWCVSTARAMNSEFKFSARHSEFVHWAIKNADVGTGLFRGCDIAGYAPQL
ncbi:MAG: DUF2272 domain-containing protein [Acidobacteria bacterium]|nr:DUF2272 domain-containing protein [Acidobacteriota bacterium]